MQSALANLLSLNNISLKEFELYAYRNLKLSVFEVVCRLLEDEEKRLEVRRELRQSRNQVLYVKELVNDSCGCLFSNEECNEILVWLKAYFRKKDKRKRYPKTDRIKICEIQNYLCNVCSSQITVSNSELDHIIPWTYVGDELENNLQMLCISCNKRKGKSIDFHLKMFLIKSHKM